MTERTSMGGFLLVHNYKQKTDWDGNYFSDYCVGCGACDHQPNNFAVSGFKENVKEITYYCKECNDKRNLINILKSNESENSDIVIDLKNDYEVDEAKDIFVSCNDCKLRIKLENSHQRIRNYARIVCYQCGEKNGDQILQYARCRQTFYCCECKKEFDLTVNDSKIIKCEQIDSETLN